MSQPSLSLAGARTLTWIARAACSRLDRSMASLVARPTGPGLRLRSRTQSSTQLSRQTTPHQSGLLSCLTPPRYASLSFARQDISVCRISDFGTKAPLVGRCSGRPICKFDREPDEQLVGSLVADLSPSSQLRPGFDLRTSIALRLLAQTSLVDQGSLVGHRFPTCIALALSCVG